jgi:lysophospholipase L1-like esterase
VTVPRHLVLAVLALLIPVLVACGIVSPEASSENADVPAPVIDVSGGLSEAGDRPTATNAADIDNVVMIGDSITNGARPFLEERFELLGLDHLLDAEDGKRMAASSSSDNPSGAAIAASLTEIGDGDHTDEVWVIALGTNDIGQYDTDDEIAAAVDEVLAEVPAEVALVWVDTWISGLPEESDVLNSVIRQRVEQRSNSVLAPWTALAGDDGVLTGDGVHPTVDGADLFAFIVTDTVRRFLGR